MGGDALAQAHLLIDEFLGDTPVKGEVGGFDAAGEGRRAGFARIYVLLPENALLERQEDDFPPLKYRKQLFQKAKVLRNFHSTETIVIEGLQHDFCFVASLTEPVAHDPPTASLETHLHIRAKTMTKKN